MRTASPVATLGVAAERGTSAWAGRWEGQDLGRKKKATEYPNGPPWVRLFHRGWLSDARRRDLPSDAQAVFDNLCFASYSRGGSLPNDEAVLRRESLENPHGVFDEAWPMIVELGLFELVEDRWQNGTCREEYDRAMGMAADNSERARHAARERWRKERAAEARGSDEGADDRSPRPVDAPSIAPSIAPSSAPSSASSNANTDTRVQIEEEHQQTTPAPAAPGGESLPLDQDPLEDAWVAWLRVKRRADRREEAAADFDRAGTRLVRWGRFSRALDAKRWLRDRIIATAEAVEKARAEGFPCHLKRWLKDNRFDQEPGVTVEKALTSKRIDEGATGANPATKPKPRDLYAERTEEYRRSQQGIEAAPPPRDEIRKRGSRGKSQPQKERS